MHKYKPSSRIATVVAVFFVGLCSLFIINNALGQVNPTATVLSPNGGEVWARNSVHTITWKTTGVVANVSIQLVKGAYIYRSINKYVLNTGSYQWIIPTDIPEGTDYKIRVKGTGVAYLAVDRSDNFFSIMGTVPGPAPTPVPTSTSIPTASGNNAQFIAQTVPSTMNAGQNYTAYLTFKNIGTTTWTKYNISSNSFGYNLGSQNPQDNTTWSINRMALSSNIQPGTQETFVFNIRAPSTSGLYNFQWRMVQELKEWFGDFSPNIVVSVLSPTPTPTLTPTPTPTPSPTPTPTSSACGLTGQTWNLATANAGWSARASFASAIFNNKMWIFGGANVGTYKSDVWSSADGINWTQVTSSAEWGQRFSQRALVFNNKMWILGGISQTVNGYVFRNDVWSSTDGVKWNLETANAGWLPRLSFGAVVYNNKMWVMGGHISGDQLRNDVWYSSDGINWTQATSSAEWTPRYDLLSASSGGKMWIIGGVADGYTKFNDVWSSADGIIWTQVTSIAGWIGDGYAAAINCNGTVFILGGSQNSIDDIWRSEDIVNWSQVTASAPYGVRTYHEALYFNNRLWILGGISSGNYKNDVWYSNSSTATPTPTPTPNPSANNAQFLSQSVPTTMNAGQQYWVSVGMKNTGTSNWTYPGLFRLGSQNPQDNLTWGLGRVQLSSASNESISPGASKTFSFYITAPSTPGTYNFQWRMVQDGVAWFGDFSPNVAVNVVSAISTPTPTPTPTPPIAGYPVCGQVVKNVPGNYSTIQAAIDAANPGDTIRVAAGIYNEKVSIKKSGICLEGAGVDQTIITKSGDAGIYFSRVSLSYDQQGSPITNRVSYVIVKNLTVKNSGGGSGYAGVWLGEASNIKFESCRVTGNRNWGGSGGFYIGYNDNITISNCLIDNNHSDQIGGGITITATSPVILNNVTVANNTADWCIGGVYMYRYNSNLTINNSILWGNSELNTNPSNQICSGKIGSANFAVNSSNIGSTYSNYNINYSDIGNWSGGTGNISLDPQFISSTDYHLQSTSPAINSGDPTMTDSDGSRIDMGVYPFVGTALTPTPTPTPTPALTDNAVYVSQNSYTSVAAGQVYPVSITMKNTGTSTWIKGALFRLGSQNPQDNLTWGLGRVELTASESIAPGTQKIFNFNITAPSTPGLYNFQWQMVQEMKEWFGDFSPNVAVNVVSATPTPTLTPTPTPTSSACTGAGPLIPGLPTCLMPENASLGVTDWNEVDNATGKVINGAVCDVSVCGRNGSWRNNGYPPNSTYLQTPFQSAYWGQYYTNGVWITGQGGTVMPGSNQITYPSPTPTPVPTVLTISNVRTQNVGQFSGDILWSTNKPSDSQVEFLGPCPSTGCLTPIDANMVSSHSINIFNLSPSVSYPFHAKSRDSGGTLATSGTYYLRTLGTTPTPTPTPTPSPLTDGAVYVGENSYTSVAAGQVYPVSLTMKNTGTSTWTRGALFRLGSQNPQDNLTWGLGRVELTASESIAPGTQKTFNFNITAPSTPGLYNFQWKMVHDGVAWFGNSSFNVPVNVYSTTPTPTPTGFSDDFSRADSATVGNGWGEYLSGSQADFAIVNNQLRMTGNIFGDVRVWHDAGVTVGVGSKFTMTFTPNDWVDMGGTQMEMLLLASAGYSGGGGYGLRAVPDSNAISIMDNGTTKITGNYSFTSGGATSYFIELLRTTNGLQVRIWPSTGSRPFTATLEHNNGSAFTSISRGNNILIRSGEQSLSNKSMTFDNVLVTQ